MAKQGNSSNHLLGLLWGWVGDAGGMGHGWAGLTLAQRHLGVFGRVYLFGRGSEYRSEDRG